MRTSQLQTFTYDLKNLQLLKSYNLFQYKGPLGKNTHHIKVNRDHQLNSWLGNTVDAFIKCVLFSLLNGKQRDFQQKFVYV